MENSASLPAGSRSDATLPHFRLSAGLGHYKHHLAMADPSPGWWKLTFLRKKKSESKVLYEIPAEFSSNTGNKEPGALPAHDSEDSQFNARLEKIVDKTATKGRHVKVSHSGRFKEKKKVRATLTENPNLFPGHSSADENHRAEK